MTARQTEKNIKLQRIEQHWEYF